MADKPIMTDVDINGQTEKFADPQHFTGENNEGRARTGEKDPFPTANYVQNDSGIWLPVSKDNPVYTKLTGSNVEDGSPIPVKEMGRAVEVIRNYSMVVTNPGNHSAGDVFGRGNDVPALDVSNYKNIMITILNNGVGDISRSSTLRIFSSKNNVSGDGNATPYTIFIAEIPRISEGGKLILTGDKSMENLPGFEYMPVLGLPFVELALAQVMSGTDNAATIQIIGESRQKSEGDN